jgi:hypothetical protein
MTTTLVPTLPFPPVLRTFHEEAVITLDSRRGTWLLIPAERDPLRTRDGRHVIPAPQRRELEKITGKMHFDRIVIAHELDPTGPIRELLPQLRFGPHLCTDETARTLVGPLPAHPGLARATRFLDRLLKGGTSTMTSLASRAADAVLDPVVFGVVGRPTSPVTGDVALWYPLVSWRW